MDKELNVQSEELNGDGGNSPTGSNSGGRAVSEATEEESEDEDVDFNPFLKGSPSEEASSSLSSDVEGLDGDVVDSGGGGAILALEEVGDHVEGKVDDVKEDEETGVSCEVEEEMDLGRAEEGGSNSGNDAVEGDGVEEQVDLRDLSIQPLIDTDDEDAICKRTRARYSLASFTLDELENFLQETDDEDDFQNVDEEEEYKKFLAAVLKGVDGDGEGVVEGNADDEDDEDNDADFEIEIEEALESDVDDCIITSNNDEYDRSSRRPKTRQNRRQNGKALDKRKGLQVERPLRPLVPITRNALPCLGGKVLTNASSVQNLQPSGFVEHQVGQLYCLIYEHVQLLVQVYSLCVLEPSRQDTASQVKGLLGELLQKRDFALAWRDVAYPTSCFLPQHFKSVVSAETPKITHADPSGVSSDRNGGQGSWLPSVGTTVLSVLDVEPLKLVGKYIIDVSNAVREHQRICVGTSGIYLEKQPLVPLPVCLPGVSSNITGANNPIPDISAVSPNDKGPKKTLAATLVESTKNSIALVPQQIAKLAEPFVPLFNSALFPHKPPSPAVANRVLFTDAEDVLLAMGMMEYNNDWKAIQQRFLPCKTEHQIFVRVKNRCSSNASENPIKSVRKMKTSPLTEDEKTRIEEGLKIFKLDWTSIWRAVVPYRDPNLLPRQWRTATGTQKSYKASAVKKEKHRIYETNRRRKLAAMGNSTASEEVNQNLIAGYMSKSVEDRMDSGTEAYVHEAFLADWRPSFTASASGLQSGFLPGAVANGTQCKFQEMPEKQGNKESESKKESAAYKVSSGPVNSHMNLKSFQAYTATGYPPHVSTLKGSGYESLLNSQRAEKPIISSLVKLSPELPPVKLPPEVRVISQSSLRSSQRVVSTEAGNDDHGCGNSGNPVQQITTSPKSSTACVSSRNIAFPERGSDLDPQMHPLLFRTPGEANLPYYSVNCSGSIPTFSFFPALQHQQMNVNFPQHHHPGPGSGSGSSSFNLREIAAISSCFDFHPLLQRSTDFNSNTIGADSMPSLLSTELELSRDGFVEETVFHATEDVGHHLTAINRPTSLVADTDDLDLDIHLNSATKKRKFSSGERTEIDPTIASQSVENLVEGAKEKAHSDHRLSPLACYKQADRVVAESGKNSGSDNSGAQLRKVGGISGACIDDNNDQPQLEIVMEQEELSDSEEEMEDVEFECEEMTDSDGEEETVAAKVVDTKYKQQENITACTDDKAQFLEKGTCSGGSRPQRKVKPPKSDLARLGKGTKGSWLSLNSRSSHFTVQAVAKGTDKSARTLDTSHSSKSSQKAPSSRKKSFPDKRTSDLSRLSTLPSSSRKPRKPPVKTMSASKAADVPVVNFLCTEKDGKDDAQQC